MIIKRITNCSQEPAEFFNNCSSPHRERHNRRIGFSRAWRLLSLAAVAVICVSFGLSLKAQNAAIKTNLLSDGLLNPNAGVEIGLAPKWTLDVSGQLNLWTVKGHKWRHWLVQPEGRYWFCRRFAGHFVGFHALGGEYNFGNLDMDFKFLGSDFKKLKDRRYEGWGAGAGIAYGYAWPVARRWNIEAEIGIGWVYTKYSAYPCANCGKKIDSGHHNYFGPTKAAVNLVYLF